MINMQIQLICQIVMSCVLCSFAEITNVQTPRQPLVRWNGEKTKNKCHNVLEKVVSRLHLSSWEQLRAKFWWDTIGRRCHLWIWDFFTCVGFFCWCNSPRKAKNSRKSGNRMSTNYDSLISMLSFQSSSKYILFFFSHLVLIMEFDCASNQIHDRFSFLIMIRVVYLWVDGRSRVFCLNEPTLM